jgi:hypothetical protein
MPVEYELKYITTVLEQIFYKFSRENTCSKRTDLQRKSESEQGLVFAFLEVEQKTHAQHHNCGYRGSDKGCWERLSRQRRC